MKKLLSILSLWLCLSVPGLSAAGLPALSLAAPGLPAAGSAHEASVLVVYYSVKGHTAAMAEAVAAGVRGVDGVSVRLTSIEDADPAWLLAADAVVVGSPVHNANVAPEVQRYINSWPFRGTPLRDKIGAAFVTGGAISAGEEVVQMSILRSMLVFGMVVAGGPHWTSAFGAAAVTEEEPFPQELAEGERVAERFLVKGRALGRRVAELALKNHPRCDCETSASDQQPEQQQQPESQLQSESQLQPESQTQSEPRQQVRAAGGFYQRFS